MHGTEDSSVGRVSGVVEMIVDGLQGALLPMAADN